MKRKHREKVDYQKKYYQDKENQGYGGPSVSSHHLHGKTGLVNISNQGTQYFNKRRF